MSRLYLDSSCIIYLVEASSPFHQVVARRLLKHQTESDAILITSRLSRLECRMRPLRQGETKLLGDYDAFFSAGRLLVAELTAEVVERATELRARYGVKTPDALHLATASAHRSNVFLTGDARLARCSEVNVEILSAP